MGLTARTLLTIGLLTATGCGGNGSDDDSTGGSSGAGGTLSTGGSSGQSETGGSVSSGASGGSASGSGGSGAIAGKGGGGTSGGTAGAGANGGSAAMAGGGSGGGPEPVAQTCDALEGRISVDGMVFSFPLVQATAIGSANNNSTAWTWGATVGQKGFVAMAGSGALPAQAGQPLDGSPLTIDHLVLAPNVGDSLGTMYAVAASSGSQLLRQSNQIDVELQKVAVLHDCGEYPVNGEIDLCHRTGGGACPDGTQGGTLDQYDFSDEVTSWISTNGSIDASVGDQGGHLSALGDPSGTGALKWAYIITSVHGHYDGKIVCASDGETVKMTDATGDYTVVHLKNLAWLEGPGNERASGCLR
jgi:hypothetical protein